MDCGKGPRAGGRCRGCAQGGLQGQSSEQGDTLEGFRGRWHAELGIARCFLQLLGRERDGRATRRGTLRPVREPPQLPRAERVVAGAKGAHAKRMEMPTGKGRADNTQLDV